MVCRHPVIKVSLLFALCGFFSTSSRAEYLVSLRGPYGPGSANQIALLSDDGTILDVDFVAPGSGGLNGPTGMYINGQTLYVASTFSSQILKYDLGTGTPLGVFAPTGGAPPTPALNEPTALVPFNADLYTANIGSAFVGFDGKTVTRLSTSTGDFLSNLGGETHTAPAGLAVRDGRLYVSQYLSAEVRYYDAAGNLAGALSDASIIDPTGLTVNPANGDLIITNSVGHSLVAFDGTNYNTFLSLPFGFYPGPVRFLDNDTFLVASTAAGSILKFSMSDLNNPTEFANFITLDLNNGVSVGDIVYFTPVPEPSTIFMTIVGAVLLSLRCWLRRR